MLERPPLHRAAWTICLAILLTGCAMGPDYERPDLILPEQWPADVSSAMTDSGDDAVTWWERYDDLILDGLVREAVEHNLDVGLAAARVAEARALLGFRRAEQLPMLDLQAEAQRGDEGRLSDSGPASSFEIAGALQYEVDLWGRLSRGSESARASLLASAFSRDAVRLTVITDVVTTYFDYRAARDQIATTEDTISSREEALELEQSRRSSGAATELALRQAEAELETSRAELPGLEAEAARLTRVLAILVGDGTRVLDGLSDLGEHGLPGWETVADLPESVPSSLIERRPDIRAAESLLIAANADIGVARASWFPRVDLAAVLGSGATAVGDLFTGPATLWELTGGIIAPVLDFGRRRADLESAEARREIAELQYRATVRTAFQEVGDAWTLLNTAARRLEIREREVQARIDVVDLADRRYTGGYTTYLEVLDARRALFQAQLSRTDAARDRLVAVANLYKALGGGWYPDEEQRTLAEP